MNLRLEHAFTTNPALTKKLKYCRVNYEVTTERIDSKPFVGRCWLNADVLVGE